MFLYNYSPILVQGSFQALLNKVQGQRADWEYPFAVAGINISFMLIQMLDLQSSNISVSKNRLYTIMVGVVPIPLV